MVSYWLLLGSYIHTESSLTELFNKKNLPESRETKAFQYEFFVVLSLFHKHYLYVNLDLLINVWMS